MAAMATTRRVLGRLAGTGALCGGMALGGAMAFDRFENSYWHKHDPWRSRREHVGASQSGQPQCKDGEEHFGWVRDESTGEPLLSPTGADRQSDSQLAEAKGGTGRRPRERVVVLGTGWGARYFLQNIDRDAYEVQFALARHANARQ